MLAAPGLPPALGAAIDRCLARDPAERFADGEALAAALAPGAGRAPGTAADAARLARRAESAPRPVHGVVRSVRYLDDWPTSIVWLAGKRPDGPADIVLLAAIASAPLVPIVGFHLNQARRQFRAGHTLADLRAALAIERRERAETEALARDEEEPAAHRHPATRHGRLGDAGSRSPSCWSLVGRHSRKPRRHSRSFSHPCSARCALGAVSNALGVQFIPNGIREWWQTGIRERLWNSRVGEWLARRLGAPERSQLAGASAFRATEAALGVAASELFAALPKDIPGAPRRAAGDRRGARGAGRGGARRDRRGRRARPVRVRRTPTCWLRGSEAAAAHLAESVAALEGIRLDLLRLHAGAGDLAPLTTLMDAARLIGEDVRRLAEAQQEVDGAAGRKHGARRTPTPA